MNDVSVHVGESHGPATVLDHQPLVVNTQQVKHGRMQVVDLQRTIDCAISEFIGCTEGHRVAHASTRHPDRISVRIVIPAIGSLGEGGSPELTCPDHQGFIQHASGSKILEKTRDALVDSECVRFVSALEIVVLVPSIRADTRAGQLDETNTPFDHSTSKQALSSEDARSLEAFVKSVQSPGRVGLVAEVHQVRDRKLHLECEFVVPYRGIDRIMTGCSLRVQLVEGTDQLELPSLRHRIDLERVDVRNGLFVGQEDRSLVGCGQEGIAKALHAAGGDEPSVENHETRQFGTLASESVARPGTHGWPARDAMPGVEEVVRTGVLGEARCHRTDDAEFIRTGGHVWKEFTDGKSALPVAPELPGRLEDVALVLELGSLHLHRKRFAGIPFEARLRVEGVDLGWTTVHVQEDDVPSGGAMVTTGVQAA